MTADGICARELFCREEPIKHVVYIIKENRTYDQVFGDVKTSGDGHAADGEPDLQFSGVAPLRNG